MNSDNKKMLENASRWIRVGFLTISVLGPAVNALSSRLRDRAETLREEATKRGSVAYSQSQERLATTGAALTNTFEDLKEHPYSKELLKRGSKATQVVVDRSSDALQELAARSEKASHELAKRSEHASKEITKRGKKVSKEVTKRSQKASKELLKRSQQAQRELAKRTEQFTRQNTQQTSPIWAALGLSMGLTAGAVAAYLLIRKRFVKQVQEEQHLHIAQNGHLNGTAKSTAHGDVRPASQAAGDNSALAPDAIAATLIIVEPVAEPITEPISQASPEMLLDELELEDNEPATEKMPSISVQGKTSQTEATLPTQEDTVTPITNAAFLGIVSIKQYYPVETPLHELRSPADEVLDVIYFITEDEAKAQGYTSGA